MQSISLYAKLFKWFSLLFGSMTQFSRNQASVAWACTISNRNQCACVHCSEKSFHCIRWMYPLGCTFDLFSLFSPINACKFDIFLVHISHFTSRWYSCKQVQQTNRCGNAATWVFHMEPHIMRMNHICH